MCLTWIAIIASLPMGIGSAVILSFTVNQDCYRNIKKSRATFEQLNRIGLGKAEDFPSEAIQMKVR